MTDETNHKITIPGFYDKVSESSEDEKKASSLIPFNIDEFKESIGT